MFTLEMFIIFFFISTPKGLINKKCKKNTRILDLKPFQNIFKQEFADKYKQLMGFVKILCKILQDIDNYLAVLSFSESCLKLL